MESIVYNSKGKETGKVKLPETMFGLPWNANLVYEVMNTMRTNARQPIAHTKTRAYVRGGGKKPWRQKGTGRARHGSTRSPLWVGGGVAHGPSNEKNFSRKLNKKTKAKAFFTILSRKLKSGQVLFIDSLSITAPKTKDAKAILNAIASIKGVEKLGTKKVNAGILALSSKNVPVEKSFRNISSIKLEETRNLNPLDLLGATYVVFENPEATLKALESKMAK
jgi:large subunit ribosomal protein L4